MSPNLLLSLPLSICLPISVSLSCIQIRSSFLLSVRLCIFTQSPLISIYFIRFFFFFFGVCMCVRVRVCVIFLSDCPSFHLFVSNPHSLRQGLPEHSKPLARCQTFEFFFFFFFVPKHIPGRKNDFESNEILCFRKNCRTQKDYFVCV